MDKVTVGQDYVKSLLKPRDPKAVGYRFLGWFRDPDNDTAAYDFNDLVNSNLTLYAKWVQVYKVTFIDSDGEEYSSVIVDKGSTAEEPDAVISEGFRYVGWYDGAGEDAAEYDFGSPVTSDLTLYLRTEKIRSDERVVITLKN